MDDVKTVMSSPDDTAKTRLSRRLVRLTLGAVDPLAGAHTTSAGLLVTVRGMCIQPEVESGAPYNILRGSIYYSK